MKSELKPTCCAGISFNGWPRGVCGKPSKIEHEGKHYCGVHNPVTRKEKRDKRDAEIRAEWAAKDAARDAAKAKQAELERRANCYPQLLEALKAIQKDMEEHPLFMGADSSHDDVDEVGGDAAFITWTYYTAANAIKQAEES